MDKFGVSHNNEKEQYMKPTQGIEIGIEAVDPLLPVEQPALQKIAQNCISIEYGPIYGDTVESAFYNLLRGLYKKISLVPNADFRSLASSISLELDAFVGCYKESTIDLADESVQRLISVSVPTFYKELVAAYPDLKQDTAVNDDGDLFAASNNFQGSCTLTQIPVLKNKSVHAILKWDDIREVAAICIISPADG